MFAGCGVHPRVPDIQALTGDAVAGEALYGTHCGTCHGADGLGGSVDHEIVESDDGHGHSHDDEEVINTILKGRTGMPSFDSLSDQEIADIVAHIHTLEGGEY